MRVCLHAYSACYCACARECICFVCFFVCFFFCLFFCFCRLHAFLNQVGTFLLRFSERIAGQFAIAYVTVSHHSQTSTHSHVYEQMHLRRSRYTRAHMLIFIPSLLRFFLFLFFLFVFVCLFFVFLQFTSCYSISYLFHLFFN